MKSLMCCPSARKCHLKSTVHSLRGTIDHSTNQWPIENCHSGQHTIKRTHQSNNFYPAPSKQQFFTLVTFQWGKSDIS